MKQSARIAAAVLAATSFNLVLAQTWCGKNYMANQTVVPPGGQFQLPTTSTEPLVAFRCSPVFRPYLEEDAKDAAIIIDTPIVYKYIQGASPISLSDSSDSDCDDLGTLDVTISIDGKVFATGEVPLNATGYEISVDISSLVAQKTRHNVTCDATYQADSSSSSSTQNFSANTTLLYLPDTDGSVVKTDLRTGTLLTRPVNGGGDFQPFVPQGFYISFDTYLAKNPSYLEQLQADGFNTIHPVPPYDNVTAFEQVLNSTIELGLYVVFDMRSIYQNLTAVAQQVNAYSSLPNLLLWETAHEPDGNSDPFGAAGNTYDLIYGMDGYHPVSIVLNCQDYNFSPYVEGADIILHDTYPLGINATWSPLWNTSCTPDFGHCGCDNCKGYMFDITSRVQTFMDRLDILGYDRSKAVWTTPQAIGSGAYWSTTPTGPQWVGMQITSFTHGATGTMSFQYPSNVTRLDELAVDMSAVITETIQPFLVDPDATHEVFNYEGIDVSLWHNGTTYLFLGTHLNDTNIHVPWASVGLGQLTSNATSQLQRVLSLSVSTDSTGFNFGPGGVGIYTATPPA